MGRGVPGVEPQLGAPELDGAVVSAARVGGATGGAVGVAQVGPGAVVARQGLGRALQGRHRLSGMAGPQLVHAEVGHGGDVRGTELEGAAVRRDRRGEVAAHRQGAAEVAEGAVAVGGELGEAAEDRSRVAVSAGGEEEGAELVVGVEVVGVQRDGALECGLGPGGVARRLAAAAETHEGAGVAGIGGEGAAERRLGFRDLTGGQARLAERDVHLGDGGVEPAGGLGGLDGTGGPAVVLGEIEAPEVGAAERREDEGGVGVLRREALEQRDRARQLVGAIGALQAADRLQVALLRRGRVEASGRRRARHGLPRIGGERLRDARREPILQPEEIGVAAVHGAARHLPPLVHAQHLVGDAHRLSAAHDGAAHREARPDAARGRQRVAEPVGGGNGRRGRYDVEGGQLAEARRERLDQRVADELPAGQAGEVAARQHHQRRGRRGRRRGRGLGCGRRAPHQPRGRPREQERGERRHDERRRERAPATGRRARAAAAVSRARRLRQLALELPARVRGVAQAPLGVLLEAALEQVVDALRRRRRQRLPLGLAGEDGGERVGGRRAAERPPAGEHLEEDAAEAPDVGAAVQRPPPRLLRAHVLGRAEDHARLGGVGSQPGRGLGGVGVAERRLRLGEPEVEHLDLASRRHLDVGGLEVAVHDAALVRGGEGVGDLPRHLQGLEQRQRAALQALLQRLPGHQLEDDVALLGGALGAVDGGDPRVVEGGEQARLALEARDAAAVAGQPRRQHLDRHLALEAAVASAVDLAHASGAERSEDLEGAEVRARGERHGGPWANCTPAYRRRPLPAR